MSDATPATDAPVTARVLVVDDEDQLRRLMGRVLARDGHEVFEAPDGDEAPGVLARSQATLAIVDLNLPPNGGAAVVGELLAAAPALRVIMTSGGDLPEDLREELVRVGASFLHKPFAPRTLLDMVQRTLRGESLPDGIA